YYTPLGQLARKQDVAGNWTTSFYNNQGLLEVVSNAFGQVLRQAFDSRDRATNVVNANGVTNINTFDDLDRLLTRAYPDGGVEKFAYSPKGLVGYTNQLGISNVFVLDAAGRKTFETNAVCIMKFKY